MNSKIIFPLALSAFVLSAGCTNNTLLDTNFPNVLSQPLTASEAQTEGKIFGALIAINQNEIALGTEAQKKASTPSVKNFANMMVQDHGRNLSDVQSLSRQLGVTPINGQTAMMLQKKGQKASATLSHLNGRAFEVAYMSMMVKGHAEALSIIDKRLISDARNPALKSQLEMTRTTVANHLQAAKQVQAELARSKAH